MQPLVADDILNQARLRITSMNFTYHDIKEALYVLQTLLGLVLIVVSVNLLNTTAAAIHPICHIVPAVTLMSVGIVCVFFGVGTYLLRDDPDIWR